MPPKNPPGADKTCGPDARVRSVSGIDGIAAGPPQRNPSLSVAPSTMDIRKARRAATRIRAMAACEACKASRCASTNSLVQLSGLLITAHAQLPARGAAINVRAGGASNTNSPPIAKSLPVRWLRPPRSPELGLPTGRCATLVATHNEGLAASAFQHN